MDSHFRGNDSKWKVIKINSMSYIYLLLLFLGHAIAQESDKSDESADYVIQEEFNDLKNWENFSFSDNKNPTQYSILEDSTGSYLKIVSQSSASGLIHTTAFDPNQYPILQWRWKVENILPEANGKTKSGDDYSLRIFVMFDDDSAETSFWTSLRNSAIKVLYGTEPPESSLCFVWANSHHEEEFYDSPYSETVKIIPVEKGDEQLNKWLSYNKNIVDLFSKIYNRSCPSSAKLAIMSDTDNTESRAETMLDFMRIGVY